MHKFCNKNYEYQKQKYGLQNPISAKIYREGATVTDKDTM